MRHKMLITLILLSLTISLFAQEAIRGENADAASILVDFSTDTLDVRSGTLSPDGSVFAVFNGVEDVVILVDSDGKILFEIPAPEDEYSDLMTFNGDGSQLIVVWSSGSVNSYDVETGESLEETMFDFPIDFVRDRALHLALDVETETLFVYVSEDDEVIFEANLSGFPYSMPSFSADGSTIAFTLDTEAFVINIDEQDEIGDPFLSLESEEGISSIAVNSDGSVVAVSDENAYLATVYDIESGEEIFVIDASEYSSAVDNLIFSPDDTVLYANIYNGILLYDAENGDLLNTLVFPVSGRIAVFDMSADGNTVFAGSYESAILIGIED